MTLDSTRNVVLLYGGRSGSGGGLSQTREWKGSNWTQMTTSTAPSARLGVRMAFDTARQVTVLFGGSTCSQTCNTVTEYGDTWEWNGTAWAQQNPATSPTPRDSFGFAYDSLRSVTV